MTAKDAARRLLKGASLFILLALILLLIHVVKPDTAFFSGFVDTEIRPRGFVGIAIYLSLAAVLSCLAIPRQLIAFAGGYAFGALYGVLWATVGVTLGCALSFGYARFLGQGFVQKRFGRRIVRLEGFLMRSPLTMTLLIRFLPVGNNLITNILAGVTRIPFLPFVAGSALGYVPQHLVFALLGSGVHVDAFWRVVLSALLFAVSSGLGLWLYLRYRHDVDAMRSGH